MDASFSYASTLARFETGLVARRAGGEANDLPGDLPPGRRIGPAEGSRGIGPERAGDPDRGLPPGRGLGLLARFAAAARQAEPFGELLHDQAAAIRQDSGLERGLADLGLDDRAATAISGEISATLLTRSIGLADGELTISFAGIYAEAGYVAAGLGEGGFAAQAYGAVFTQTVDIAIDLATGAVSLERAEALATARLTVDLPGGQRAPRDFPVIDVIAEPAGAPAPDETDGGADGAGDQPVTAPLQQTEAAGGRIAIETLGQLIEAMGARREALLAERVEADRPLALRALRVEESRNALVATVDATLGFGLTVIEESRTSLLVQGGGGTLFAAREERAFLSA
ncbi:MAG: hypothetical protein AAFR52_13425 [Pseudomonadota bacterium]